MEKAPPELESRSCITAYSCILMETISLFRTLSQLPLVNQERHWA